MSWTGPEVSQTLGCLLPPTVPSDFFQDHHKLVGSWTIFNENHGVHPASNHLPQKRTNSKWFPVRWVHSTVATGLNLAALDDFTWFRRCILIFLEKMSAVWLFIYIKRRWFYDSLETLLWWKGSMASRWMFESCAASTAIWVLRCFEYFVVARYGFNQRSMTTLGHKLWFNHNHNHYNNKH